MWRVKGFSQKKGLDCGETFNFVANMVRVRSHVVAVVVSKGW